MKIWEGERDKSPSCIKIFAIFKNNYGNILKYFKGILAKLEAFYENVVKKQLLLLFGAAVCC